jgi:hypothetical protein
MREFHHFQVCREGHLSLKRFAVPTVIPQVKSTLVAATSTKVAIVKPCRINPACLGYGPRLVASQGSLPSVAGVTGAGGVGGVAQGTALKSKNSSRFGCAASRAVR